MLLDQSPGLFIWFPGMRCSLFRCERRKLIGVRNATRVDGADLHPFTAGLNAERPSAVGEGNVYAPACYGSIGIVPDESRRSNLLREDRAVLRIVDGERCAGR